MMDLGMLRAFSPATRGLRTDIGALKAPLARRRRITAWTKAVLSIENLKVLVKRKKLRIEELKRTKDDQKAEDN